MVRVDGFRGSPPFGNFDSKDLMAPRHRNGSGLGGSRILGLRDTGQGL